MFLATVPRTRAVSPAFRSFDGNFERFINEAFSAGTRTGTENVITLIDRALVAA